MTEWQACSPARYHLGEGARWHEGRLVHVDLLRGDLHRSDPRSDRPPDHVLALGVPLGAVAPAAVPGVDWIVAAGDGIALVGAAGPRWLARPEYRTDRSMRMNDGVCDSAGRFWAGSMELRASDGAGSLYRVDPDGSVKRVLDGLTVPNGPAFGVDGTYMYLADSAHGTITRYAVDVVTGRLARADPFAELAAHEGRPDGMAVDDDGNLWVALWGGGRIRCYSPDGSVIRDVPVPTPQPSSVAFGDGLVIVTTARHRLSHPDGLAGAVLVAPTTVTAPPALAFGRIPRA
ncbi:SMP-30/gluconolactonase/LRE family protein [Streptomyces sp. S1]|uniref:SMP-30/gluconolactonase/LRE family protein n=1 Tax=Streptomyces sp. S1 TaxID=718288 RepID=UPI000EF78518|nr:SMP-30/gluconolactonase/LRE family protein [Streptomyces sp. S1]